MRVNIRDKRKVRESKGMSGEDRGLLDKQVTCFTCRTVRLSWEDATMRFAPKGRDYPDLYFIERLASDGVLRAWGSPLQICGVHSGDPIFDRREVAQMLASPLVS